MPGFTRPVVIAAVVVAAVVIAPVVVAAGLLTDGFGKLYQSSLIIVAPVKTLSDWGIAVEIGLITTALITAIVAPVIAVVAITLTITVAVLLVCGLLIAVILATILATILLAIPATLRGILLILLALFLLGGQLAVGFGKHAGVMFGVLREILGGNAVIRQLGVAGQLLIFLNDLLRCAAHLAFGARAVEHTVGDVAEGARAVWF